jgi:hypothetical protein
MDVNPVASPGVGGEGLRKDESVSPDSWRIIMTDDNTGKMMFRRATKGALKLACLTISEKPCGAVALGVGSVVAVFGKQPCATAPDNTLARGELDLVRKGLTEAGAEEICALTFGGGYLLFVQPRQTEHGDAGADGEPERRWADYSKFCEFLERLRELACRVSSAVQEGHAANANLAAPATTGMAGE